MPIYYDDQLTALAWDKAEKGCRKPIKEGCDFYEVVGDSDKFIKHLQKADQMGFMKEDLVLTIIRVNQAVCFFKKPIEEVRKFIEGVQPVVKGEVGPKVLDKMVYIRLCRVKREIDQHNHYVITYPNHVSKTTGLMDFPELRTIQQLKEFLVRFEIQHYNGQWGAKRLVNAFHKEVISKPELLDENVSRGYDLYTINGIMEE